jgi:uncharacterized membrane protein
MLEFVCVFFLYASIWKAPLIGGCSFGKAVSEKKKINELK